MVPPCSTTNRRVWSPGGEVRNTGELRLLATVWSLRLVEVGAAFSVLLSLPHAARRPAKHRHRGMEMIACLMVAPSPCLKDDPYPIISSGANSLVQPQDPMDRVWWNPDSTPLLSIVWDMGGAAVSERLAFGLDPASLTLIE